MKPARTQQDTNMNFDGMESMAPKHSSKYHTNAWSGHLNDGRLVNKGRGPTVGNQCYDGVGGPSVTRDQHRYPPTASVPALPAQGSVRDSINRGSQYRGTGGTAVKKPSNPDSIRVGQTGGTAYGAVSRGSRPVASGSTEGINYGPKSQY